MDLIERWKAIDVVCKSSCKRDAIAECSMNGDYCSEVEALRKLPSVQPEPKTGQWVYDENGMDWNLGAWVCSKCHMRNDNIPPGIKFNDGWRKVGNPYMWQGSKFCPNCGVRMIEEVEQDDEYKRASDMRDYCERYESTYNSDDGSM